ncbi:serine/threonine-protein kinase [Akkermansiaceae bacterium]|nr:serine/threonine-protein kinase [Akkermansiaceae bacterium]
MKPLEEDALIKGIVARALECDEGRRRVMVHEECAGNEELIAKVFSILECEELKTLADNGTESPASKEGFPARKVGPYTLRGAIGEGGFAEVFLAEQQEPVRRKVALKILKPGMDSRELLARFEVERQALALMQHSGVAKIFDAGITENGRSWFAMEHVEGVCITDYCDTNRLGLPERLTLFIQVCEAVQHAHQKGVIHRDIKPNNILVGLSEGKPRVKVIDFGIAKATGPSLTEKTLFTAQGMLIGTPAYMSPEQAEMSGADIDTRSDVYSLGILLYELLVGEPPFHPKRLLQAGYGEILRIIREEQPQKLSEKSTTIGDLSEIAASRELDELTLSKRLNGDLDWITLKALEKDRTRRYSTIQEFAADVSRHLNNEPVTAGPPSFRYSFKKFVRRNRVGVSATAAIFLTLTAGVIISTWQWQEARNAKEVAIHQREAAVRSKVEAQKASETAMQEREKALKAAKMEEAQRKLAQLQTARALEAVNWYGDALAGIDFFSAGNVLEKAISERGKIEELDYTDVSRILINTVLIKPLVDSVETTFPEDLEMKYQLYSSISGNLPTFGLLKESHELFKKSYQIVREKKVYSEYNSRIQKYLSAKDLGLSFHRLENYEEAEKLLSESIAELVKLENLSDSEEAAEDFKESRSWTLQLLGDTKLQLSKDEDARMLFREAIELGNQLAVSGLADLEMGQNRLSEAEKILLKALSWDQPDFEHEGDELDWRVFKNGLKARLGKVYLFSGEEKLDSAEILLNEVIDFENEYFGEGHPNAILAKQNLGLLYEQRSMFSEAESIVRDCIEGYEKLNDFRPSLCRCYYKLISILVQQRKLEEARRLKGKLITLLAKLDGSEFGGLRVNLMVELVKMDREDSSQIIKELRFAVQQAVEDKVDKDTRAYAYMWLGIAEFDSENFEKSQECLEKAYSIRKATNPQSSDTAETARALGMYWKRVARFDLAEKFYRESLAIYRGVEKDVDSSYNLSLCLKSLGSLLKDLDRLSEAKIFLVELVELLEIHPEILQERSPQLIADLAKAKNLNEKLNLFGNPLGPSFSVDTLDESDPFAPKGKSTE